VKRLVKAIDALHGIYVYPRRYFYPSLETLNYVEPNQAVEISKDISKRVLCCRFTINYLLRK
jgi:hypothetical protein